MLNTSGEILVAVGDGSWMVVISRPVLEGDEWLDLEVPLRIAVPEDAASQSAVAEFCRKTSLYYAAKVIAPGDAEVRLMSDLPATDLRAMTLLGALRRIAWILSAEDAAIQALPGTPPPVVFRSPQRSIVPDPPGVADYTDRP